MDIIRKRCSVRDYLDKPVEEEKINEIVEAVKFAPSSCNSQCWRFVVTTGEIKEQITKQGIGGVVLSNRWAKTAPVIIVACADLSFVPHRIGAKIKDIEWYLLDMGIAIEHLVLRATELGLGTCWIGWFNESAIRKILKIPRGIKIVALLTLGYPKDELAEHEKQRLEIDKILFWNAWGNYKQGG
ncbi:MAG: nitroreductase family protein [Candidatus Stahlbacteria bacterium]|nr:nitroreductase family protein [Candidatus Stahlbacteria bacterium]